MKNEQGDLFGFEKPVQHKPKTATKADRIKKTVEIEPNPVVQALQAKAEQFHARLKSSLGEAIRLRIHRNLTSFVSFGRHEGILTVRLHSAFLDAPDPVFHGLVDWIKKKYRRAPDVVRSFVQSIPSSIDMPARRRLYHRTSAGVYDLRKIFDNVNGEFFDGKIQARITFGRDNSRQQVHIRRLGSFSHQSNLITIHPLLDDRRIPEFVISFIVYHEMLHALQPKSHKRPHDAAFRLAEKSYPRYDEVIAWQKKNERLLNGGKPHGKF